VNRLISGRAILVLLIALCFPPFAAAANLTFQWDPPPSGVPAGYILYAGTAPDQYVQQINVGLTTSYTLTGVPEGATYYFSVAAYDASGVVGGRSNEVSATIPISAPPPVTSLALAPSLPSPQVVGTTINWLATASGGVTPYQYQWSSYQSGQWTIGPWTSGASTTWIPSTAGDYQIRVGVRSAGSTSVSGEMLKSVPFTVSAVTPTCVVQPPTVSVAQATGLTYNVIVTNSNGAGCTASVFALSATVPTGWSATFNPVSSASMAPGASATATASLSAASGASGTYSFTVTATDTSNGQSGAATGTATIAATPPPPSTAIAVTVSISVNNGRDRAATLKVKAKVGGQAAAGAAITAIIRSPRGAVSSLNGTTDSSGNATLRYPLTPDDSGTYQAQLTASINGSTGTATTTFAVR
jgi:hypothetical protein